MTWQPMYDYGYTSSDKTNSATFLVYLTFAVGQLTVLSVSFDNLTATTPTVTSIYKPSGETANWVLLAYHNSNQSGGGGGVRTELWGIIPQVTSEAWSGQNITLSASVGAKTSVSNLFAGGGSTLQVRGTYPASGIASSTAISTSVQGLTGVVPNTGDLIFVLQAMEGTSSISAPGTGWSGNGAGTSGQGAASNMTGMLWWKVAPFVGDHSLTFSDTADKGISAVVLTAGPAAPPANATGSGTLEAHKTRYPDLVKSISPYLQMYYRFNEKPEDFASGGMWWLVDESPRRHHLQVYPSYAGGSYTPGAPMPAGNWVWRGYAESLAKLDQPGLIFGGDTGQDSSVSPRSWFPTADNYIYIDLWDPWMSLAGGGRYYSPQNETGLRFLTLAAMVNLEAYPTDQAGAPADMTVGYNDSGRWYARITSDGKLNIRAWVRHDYVLDGNVMFTYNYTGATQLQLGHTHHVAWVFSGTYFALYIDGVQDGYWPINYVYQPPGTQENQRVTIAGSPTGGSFTLTFSGQTTGPIAYNAAASTVQAALEALSNIAPGDVYVSGTYSQTGGWYWEVYFNGVYQYTNVAQMTANGAGLTGGTSPTVTVTTVQEGASPPAPVTYTSGEIEVTVGSGGTDAGSRAWWEPGFRDLYFLSGMPKGRIDELALWSAAVPAADIASLANAAFVDKPGAALRGKGKLTALQPYLNEVLVKSPEVYYRFNDAPGSTVMTDYSGHDRHGTYVGSPTLGQSGLVAGSDTAMKPAPTGNTTTAKGGTLPYATWMMDGDFTWEWMFKAPSGTELAPNGQAFMMNAGELDGHVSYYNDRVVWIVYTEAGVNYTTSLSSELLTQGQTYHVALVAEGLERRIYVDGVEVASMTCISKHLGNSSYPLTIGHWVARGTGYYAFASLMDEFAMYSTALDPTTILNHSEARTIAPFEPKANFSGSGAVAALPAPAFAVGVARSGSSLLEAAAGQGYFAHLFQDGAGSLVPVVRPSFSSEIALSGESDPVVEVLNVGLSASVPLAADGNLVVTQAFRPIQKIEEATDSTLEPQGTPRRFWGKAVS